HSYLRPLQWTLGGATTSALSPFISTPDRTIAERADPDQAKKMWRPPPPVRLSTVVGSRPYSRSRSASKSSPPLRGSTSSTTRRDRCPVTMPTFESGHSPHQPAMTSRSTEARSGHLVKRGCLPGCLQSGVPHEQPPSRAE